MTAAVPALCRRCDVPLHTPSWVRSRAWWWHPTRDCSRCHVGRGLCKRCRRLARLDGTLADYPRLTLPADDVLDDYEILASDDLTRDEIARRVGVSVRRLDEVLRDARRRGDRRAEHQVLRVAS